MQNKPSLGPLVVQFKRLHPARDADIPLPTYMTPLAAGMDICAALTEPLHIPPGDIVRVPTGLAMALPKETEAQIRPRSGLAVKHGVTVINAPGTIDADYRGEVMVALINLGKKPFTVFRGDRIAQMIIQKVCQVKIQLSDNLEDTSRGHGGFGHTGLSQKTIQPMEGEGI